MTHPSRRKARFASRQRAAMVRQIRAEALATAVYTGLTAFSPAVMKVMARVPRHRFVAPEWVDSAYVNTPLTIGYGQTISQPFMVALMTELAAIRATATVLEIGCGSGYQAAILARLARRVYSIERVEPLAMEASQRLAAMGYSNVEVRAGDGYYGWPEQAPFDAILITAAVAEVPPPLLAQLKPGGRMVVPLGTATEGQELTVLTRHSDGMVTQQRVLPVAFVPFLHRPEGQFGYNSGL
ncbi:MAG: protein-L-isoaspartate(D-aspartate) O-methyltransferase [Methylococcaceae bacterium]|jgi:protein-L-isoaspartate(D-aspartate) O-methyltransferase